MTARAKVLCQAIPRGGEPCRVSRAWLDPKTGDFRCIFHNSTSPATVEAHRRRQMRVAMYGERPPRKPRPPRVPDEVRFWRHVKKSDGCWEWTAGNNGHGYGWATRYRQLSVAAHRFSWEMHFGPIPPGLIVCHHCDNPPCVRPDHLFVGTYKDNMQDCVRKGRLIGRRTKKKL